MVYSNKTWDDIIFRDELDGIQRQHSDKLRILHSLTREEPPIGRANVRRGRVDTAMLKDAIPDPSSCVVYMCGPANGPHEKAAAKAKGVEPTPRFLETALAGLKEIGVSEDRIEYESYG
jgi:ferredoxin-NADP reductase